jgi:Transposase
VQLTVRSNAKTEAANLTIKNIKRAGRGYRSTTNYTTRIMLYNAARTAAGPPGASRGKLKTLFNALLARAFGRGGHPIGAVQ